MRHVHVAPLWTDVPDPTPTLGDYAHLAPSTVDHAIDLLKDEQAAYLERLDNPRRRRRRALTPQMARSRQPQPVLVRHTRPADACPAGVHPLAWAHALKSARGDVRRLEITASGDVLVRNRAAA